MLSNRKAGKFRIITGRLKQLFPAVPASAQENRIR